MPGRGHGAWLQLGDRLDAGHRAAFHTRADRGQADRHRDHGADVALATNDEIKEAKLTMRKPGSEQVDYFLITLNNARCRGDPCHRCPGQHLGDGDVAVHQGRSRIPAAEEHGRPRRLVSRST